MKSELARWSNGTGIDLESWVGCMGNFSLAVGYATVFWPEFVAFENYILRKDFPEPGLRNIEKQPGVTGKDIEWHMNHMHLDNIQALGCDDISKDKLELLGKTLKEIHEVKLQWQVPGKPCAVEFYIPEDPEDFTQYQISFWQIAHKTKESIE